MELRADLPACKTTEKVRKFRFQSCWDGRNIDSADHRSHVAFADPTTGACPSGFVAVPHLTMRLVYNVPSGPTTPSTASRGMGTRRSPTTTTSSRS
ncbi:DUF1996 domain-containing protein [Streptomyces sp. NY05-11A]|uniref:DUF1996 domain-containing protein n=1 Tax=Streptomyces soliscabiei TaxID=588897 RepID=UPI0039F65273